MTGKSPTVWAVYVRLKSVVSCHWNGSSHDGAPDGMLLGDMPPKPEVLESDPSEFFLLTTTATAIMMISRTNATPPIIPINVSPGSTRARSHLSLHNRFLFNLRFGL